MHLKVSPEKVVREVRRKTRRKFSSEENIHQRTGISRAGLDSIEDPSGSDVSLQRQQGLLEYDTLKERP
jgi:hypothetical protein